MEINKKNLVRVVKALSLSSVFLSSGCALTFNELVNSKGPYGGVEYKKSERSIIFDYEKKVGPLPASTPSAIKPQPYRENLRERRENYK